MLKITKVTGYGFILLEYMASEDAEKRYSAKELSEVIDVPLPTVSKVLKILNQAGVLVSHQGSKGGYSLARPPNQITATEIIEAVEGPVAITDCSGKGCDRNCKVGASWRKINSMLVDALSDMSLTDIVRR